jgi:Cu/Zn superoxide dismutase
VCSATAFKNFSFFLALFLFSVFKSVSTKLTYIVAITSRKTNKINIMKKITKFLLAAAIGLAGTSAQADHLSSKLLVTARMDGAQQVPAVTTNAVGVGSFFLNSSRDTMCVDISVNGLSGAITGAHLHEAAPGATGPVVLDLSSFVTGNRITGRITGATSLSKSFLSKMLSGGFYINVHTAANPNGEIRGQLKLESDQGFYADLSGSQEVPAVSTNAYGVGAFNLSLDGSKLSVNVVVQNLSGAITGAHLHTGARGATGGVVSDLTPFVSGNVISGQVDPSTFLNDLRSGNIYVNVHTAANPGGEIRGQLDVNKHLVFDASLNGAQEVPPVTTNAKGVGSLRLNTTMDTLYYDIVSTGLSGAITGAHIHGGAIGTAGGVLIDLTNSITGNRIKGNINGAPLTKEIINQMLVGETYLNLHTAANPNGEIRGQVYRLAREGYTYSMDGAQEVPPVTTNATGAGMVSVDRDQTNAHYMVVISGLTPSGAHFHEGAKGQTGAVIFDLTPSFSNNGAFGYWTGNSTTPFITASSRKFRKDSVYINVHTTAHPNGELRGQAGRTAKCEAGVLGIEEAQNLVGKMNVYPNPSSSSTTVYISAARGMTARLTVTDVLGKVVYNAQSQLYTGDNYLSIDASALQNGLYFIRLSNEEGVLAADKLIKN